MEWLSNWWLWIGLAGLLLWTFPGLRRRRSNRGWRGTPQKPEDPRTCPGHEVQTGDAGHGTGRCCGHGSHGRAQRKAEPTAGVVGQPGASHAAHSN